MCGKASGRPQLLEAAIGTQGVGAFLESCGRSTLVGHIFEEVELGVDWETLPLYYILVSGFLDHAWNVHDHIEMDDSTEFNSDEIVP